MSDPMAAHVIGHAISKLVDRLTRLQEHLVEMVAAGADADEIEQQRQDILVMEQRITAAEKVQESYL